MASSVACERVWTRMMTGGGWKLNFFFSHQMEKFNVVTKK